MHTFASNLSPDDGGHHGGPHMIHYELELKDLEKNFSKFVVFPSIDDDVDTGV